jgi:hypothetical protein
MDQDIPEAGYVGKGSGEDGIQDTQFTHPQDGIVVVSRLSGIFDGNDAVADIYAALCGNLQVPFRDVAKIGVGIEIGAGSIPERP